MSILPQAFTASGKHLVQRCLDALLPASCLLCGERSAGQLLCMPCQADLPKSVAAQCPQCAEPTTHGERCGACLKEPPAFDRTVALWRYDFPLDRIIHALKYQHRLAVAGWLGRCLAERLTAETYEIIPMPLHPERLRERGFNQALEIARSVAGTLQRPLLSHQLIRQRDTASQAELPFGERHRNVRGAFASTADLTGRRLILIDDVMTTGATARECARVLKLHGASEVTVAVAARALKH